jgi:hypothetical protein
MDGRFPPSRGSIAGLHLDDMATPRLADRPDRNKGYGIA